MRGVLGSIAGDGSDATIVHLEWDVETNNTSATLDDFVHVLWNVCL